ncbi:MAG: hypothetical protein KGL39_37035 [Patescibacteria group bacterium]|nr:hypothetical protein [Patescibacteria group bacterium]
MTYPKHRRAPTNPNIRPTEESLRNLLLEEGLTVKQVAQRLGYGEHGWSNVYAWCRKYGIEFDLRPNHDIRSQEFSPRQRDVVYGTLMGDGYIRPGKKHDHLVLGHSSVQAEYLEWKRNELQPFFPSAMYANVSGGHSKNPTLYYASVAHHWLTDLREEWYGTGVKSVTRSILDKLSPLSVAVWFMDDGSLNRHYGTMFWATMGFPYDEQVLIQAWLRERYLIESVIEPRRNGQFGVRVNSTEARKLRSLIKPHVPGCMRYKVEYP